MNIRVLDKYEIRPGTSKDSRYWEIFEWRNVGTKAGSVLKWVSMQKYPTTLRFAVEIIAEKELMADNDTGEIMDALAKLRGLYLSMVSSMQGVDASVRPS